MTLLQAQNISFSYDGTDQYLLSNISLDVKENEFIAIMGPSGVGKSTFIDLLAGLQVPTKGDIFFQGKRVSDNKDSLDLHTRHNVGIIFQNYGLFPWLTVEKHILFGLLNTKKTKAEKLAIVDDVLQKIGLYEAKDKYPHELSGGMQQRLAVGSILANDSPCLLMDEPFAAIDIVTRHKMQEFLLEIHSKFQKTIIFITHQIDEALLLADRILIFGGDQAIIQREITLEQERPRELHSKEFLAYRKEIYDHLKST